MFVEFCASVSLVAFYLWCSGILSQMMFTYCVYMYLYGMESTANNLRTVTAAMLHLFSVSSGLQIFHLSGSMG